MANQRVRFTGPPGAVDGMNLCSRTTGAIVQATVPAAQFGSIETWYISDVFDNTLAGSFVLQKLSGADVVGYDFVTLVNASATYDAEGLLGAATGNRTEEWDNGDDPPMTVEITRLA